MRTQVVIIGGGPSGLLLSQALSRQGIESVVLERRSRAHVLGRIRAGVLEHGSCALLRRAGVGARLEREGIRHDGTLIARGDRAVRIDLRDLTGHSVTVYGQTEVTRDLYAARDAAGGTVLHDVADVALHDLDGDAPSVTFRHEGRDRRAAGDFVVGCDGFHGPSRQAIPAAARREFERVYPFGWLGVLSETPPVDAELIYAGSDRGFALCSMRNANLSRYYVQCDLSDRPEAWTDDAFWDELRRRIPPAQAEALVIGPSIEKSIAPLRSFVCEPMRRGRLFLCGDAAHIVPPTGAKGLNLALSDVGLLQEALGRHFSVGDKEGIDRYSERALAAVWKAQRFSWWFTRLLHRFADETGFDRRLRAAEFAALCDGRAARAAMAESYVGLR
ncbi:4-hydroxybenzoate 3-monooxygenase [Jannaschia sp. S6380]|uniref:4-hydroxybenzoate 3-monooxygenase n=1 Tax=Jannaschia sp. S6380 TaxID=2926408 RepID=UPI001FF38778|nr:4-hydroxybenzoate 3-monooxygenase [Jannaschia sp. S6380]MCK0168038.1 4-hydroxybenzoate 3-monooxygenase [Jannaschia sp. S6380]